MSEETPTLGLPVPAHIVPLPSTVSAHAQAFLSQRMAGAGEPVDLADKASWHTHIAESNGWLTEALKAGAAAFPCEIITHQLAGCALYEMVPENLSSDLADCAILYLHGGAFIFGSGLAAAYMGAPLASHAGMRMFSVDYGMPPDHPYPSGLDDAVAAYSWLLERYRPEKIAIAGTSAGGGLAAGLALKLRDLGLPMPGACVLATPEVDLTESGDTFETNIYNDVVITKRLTQTIALYADGHDLTDPYLSPLFGDFSKGYPPTLLNSGTRDVFLSNTVRMHRKLLKAGIETELHVWEAMPHGGFFGAPEDMEVYAQQAEFVRRKLRG
jgi:monoterpene epsilon-lactone hydrolase